MPSDIDALAEGLQLLEDEGLEQYATIDIVPTDEYAKALAATTPVAALLARAALANELAERLLAHRYQSVGPITGDQWVQHGHEQSHRKAENCLTCAALAKWEASRG